MAAVVIAEAPSAGKIIFIYALIDPITKKRRYIGKTNNIPQRLRAHESEARYSRTHKSNWVRGLQKLGLRPDVECLEVVPAGRRLDRSRDAMDSKRTRRAVGASQRYRRRGGHPSRRAFAGSESQGFGVPEDKPKMAGWG